MGGGWGSVSFEYVVGLFLAALVVAACGGGSTDGADSTVTTVDTTTTAAAAVTTTVAPTTTTTDPGITYASLDDGQKELVDRICATAADPTQNLVGEVTYMEVITGFIGIPDLEAAWSEIDIADRSALLEAAAPICADLNWSPPPATTTTTILEAMASVTVLIGDIQIQGETPGCPMTEILANEHWFGPNREDWTDINGEAWEVNMSVDATEGDLKWSFSFTQSPHRLISYHLNESRFEADVTEDTGVFNTYFGDSLASISGGYPDMPGTIAITCR